MTKKINRRSSTSKPKVFNEQRESMWLIESAKPGDIYLWCFCIVTMTLILFTSLVIAYIEYKGV